MGGCIGRGATGALVDKPLDQLVKGYVRNPVAVAGATPKSKTAATKPPKKTIEKKPVTPKKPAAPKKKAAAPKKKPNELETEKEDCVSLIAEQMYDACQAASKKGIKVRLRLVRMMEIMDPRLEQYDLSGISIKDAAHDLARLVATYKDEDEPEDEPEDESEDEPED